MDKNDHHFMSYYSNMSCENTLMSLDSQESSYTDHSNFEVSEFFDFNDWIVDDQAFMVPSYQQHPNCAQNEVVNSFGSSSYHEALTRRDDRSMKVKKDIKEKVAFRTMSHVEILDDGFKWRKYGKKMVKNSPNPRNYYRCSAEGCPVKKRVERDKEDTRYVITTYEAVHNHPCPSQI